MLLDIARMLADAESDRAIWSLLVGDVASVIGASAAAVYLCAGSELELVAVNASPEPPRRLPMDLEIPLPVSIRTNEPVFVETPEQLEERFPMVNRMLVVTTKKRKSSVCLPLACGAEVIGGLAFGFDVPHALGDDERAFLVALKKHAAIAIERSRARRRLAIIARAARAFGTVPHEPIEAATIVAREVASNLECAAGVHLLSADRKMLELAALDDPEPDRLASARTALDRAPVKLDAATSIGRVVTTGTPLVARQVDMASVLAATRSEAHRAHLVRFPFVSLAVLPLRAAGELLGTLTASRHAGSPPLEAEDETVLADLADRGALVIQNARVHDRARRALRDREQTMAVISHDLRTPLSSLALAIDSLERRFESETEPPRSLGTMKRSIRHMQYLVENLVDLARIDGGGLAYALVPLDADGLIAEAIAAHEDIAQRASLALVAFHEPLGLVVGDRDALLRVFSNLIGNAIKFTRAPGRIEVRGERLPGAVRFIVADTGIGIPAENLPHVFDRYWQASGRMEKGVGLGLTIARAIVAAHDGEITVESALGKGTSFSFRIPAPVTSG